MENFNILYGFSSEQVADKVSKALKTLGLRVATTMRPSKILIRDFLVKELNLDAVILKEFLDGGDQLTVQDLIELADETTANFVVLLSSKYQGSDDMKKLYNAGILNAYFLDGKRGADPLKVAELAAKGRIRKDARSYYKIDNQMLDRTILTYGEYAENIKYLLNKDVGANIVDRFVTISHWLTGPQMAKFIGMIPDNVLTVLRKYDEYYVVQTKLFRARCMPIKEKKPKDVKKALSDAYLINLLQQDREGHPVERIVIPQPKAVKTSSAIYNRPDTQYSMPEKQVSVPSDEIAEDTYWEEKEKQMGYPDNDDGVGYVPMSEPRNDIPRYSEPVTDVGENPYSEQDRPREVSFVDTVNTSELIAQNSLDAKEGAMGSTEDNRQHTEPQAYSDREDKIQNSSVDNPVSTDSEVTVGEFEGKSAEEIMAMLT